MFDWTRRLFAMALVATLSACGGGRDEITLDPPHTVVQIAQTDSGFTVLAEAVVAANLVTARLAPGPLNVFAPAVGPAITTVNGETLTASAMPAITDRRVRTSNTPATDVLTRNGVIHVFDKVLLPAR